MSDTKLAPSLMELEFLKSNLPNILVNGGFEIWQRGASFSTPASAAKTADMWAVDYSGTVSGHTCIFSKESGAGNVEGRYSMKLDYQVKGSTTAARIYQGVGNSYDFVGKSLTFSVRVKTSVASAVRLILSDGATTYSQYHTGGGGWETLVVTSASSSPGTRTLYVQCELVGVYYIDSATCVVGTQSVPFITEDYAIELIRCQRYYEKSYAIDASPATITATNLHYVNGTLRNTNDVMTATVPFKVQKVATPTITLYTQGGTSGQWAWTNNAASKTNRVTTADAVGTNGFNLRQQVSGTDLFGEGHWTAEVV
jgi:hypothetical protein